MIGCYLVWADGTITTDDGWLVLDTVEELIARGEDVRRMRTGDGGVE